MRNPVLVNLNVSFVAHDTQKVTSMVNRVVIDLYYKNIVKFVNGGKGNTIVQLFDYNQLVTYDVQITFEEMYEIYSEQDPIDERFKEDVDLFKNDNLNGL